MPATLKKIAYEDSGAVLRLSLDLGTARPLTLRILAEDGDTDTVTALSPGRELSDATLAALRAAADRYEAHLRALRALAYTDHSARALTRKLREKGSPPAAAQAAVDAMLARGYIREDEQAYRLAVARANRKCHGPRRVLATLLEKGYPPDTARAAIRRAVEEGEIDFPALAARLVEEKLGADPDREEKRKLLYKHGF